MSWIDMKNCIWECDLTKFGCLLRQQPAAAPFIVYHTPEDLSSLFCNFIASSFKSENIISHGLSIFTLNANKYFSTCGMDVKLIRDSGFNTQTFPQLRGDNNSSHGIYFSSELCFLHEKSPNARVGWKNDPITGPGLSPFRRNLAAHRANRARLTGILLGTKFNDKDKRFPKLQHNLSPFFNFLSLFYSKFAEKAKNFY